MKIGILNGGGDVQALNAVIASVVKSGTKSGHEIIGFEKGWEGILDPPLYRPLPREVVRGISHQGGTILGTTNKGRFAGKIGAGDVFKIPQEIIDMAKRNLESLGIEALIVIGGDGTLTGALQLAQNGVNIVGIPKTIDNDLKSTDKTFGFNSALGIISEALDRIHTTAKSHDRVILIEVMGRHTGWLALYGGLSGGADIILIPEIQFSYQKLLDKLKERKETGYRSTLVVVAEGASSYDEAESTVAEVEKSEVQLGGIANHVMQKIENMAPGEFELRTTVLGHIQRGGTPSAEDRVLAKMFGVAAIEAIERRDFGSMISIKGNDVVTVKLEDAVESLKRVTNDSQALNSAKKIGIYFGD